MAGPSTGLKGLFTTGQGAPGASGWEPTITYLLILIVAEMVVFGFISRRLRLLMDHIDATIEAAKNAAVADALGLVKSHPDYQHIIESLATKALDALAAGVL